jgi:hypothetical protein
VICGRHADLWTTDCAVSALCYRTRQDENAAQVGLNFASCSLESGSLGIEQFELAGH